MKKKRDSKEVKVLKEVRKKLRLLVWEITGAIKGGKKR